MNALRWSGMERLAYYVSKLFHLSPRLIQLFLLFCFVLTIQSLRAATTPFSAVAAYLLVLFQGHQRGLR